jgi:hypothetical protein
MGSGMDGSPLDMTHVYPAVGRVLAKAAANARAGMSPEAAGNLRAAVEPDAALGSIVPSTTNAAPGQTSKECESLVTGVMFDYQLPTNVERVTLVSFSVVVGGEVAEISGQPRCRCCQT